MIDRVFGTRYRLIEKIGIGGMAEVFKATDEVLGRTVAVKVMLPQYASDPTFAARFKQEAQSAANLASPYIVNIYDWGHEESDNTYFIVMEYVRGTDLKTAIQQRGAINQRKAAEIGSQVCAALSVAHAYDIIHRDIKPHNIMVQPDGNAKVMDFGIARANGSSMTQTGSVLGTAYYVSPEQAQGKALTPATDLYSLGIVLYEATTGRVPFDAPDAVAVALKQVNENPIPPSHINPDIDPELEAIILRAMAKNLNERYATAEQMRTALNNYLAGRPIDAGVPQPAAETRVMAAALPVIGADGAQPPAHTAVMPSVGGPTPPPLMVRSSAKAKEEQQRKNRKRATIIGVIATILVILAVGVGIYFLSSGGNDSVEVPDVVGMSEEDARKKLEDADLKVQVSLEASAEVEKGKVIKSDPSAKTKVTKESIVKIFVSNGPEAPAKVIVPDLRNLTPDEAKKKLEELHLGFDRGDDRFDAEIASGKICAQDIAANEEVDEGTTVTFYVSKGKDTGEIPNVEGESQAVAEAMIQEAGFVVGYEESEYSDTVAEGIVIRQSPKVNNKADKGSTVTITVSLGVQPMEVPDLTSTKTSKSDAEAAVLAAGLTPVFIEEVPTETAMIGYVLSQDPAAGTSLPKGSQVTITIGKAPTP